MLIYNSSQHNKYVGKRNSKEKVMVTLQGVIILRVSDFRRFFDWEEFWAKKADFTSVFKKEIIRRTEIGNKPQEEYYFVDNDAEFYLVQKFYEWLICPTKELVGVSLSSAELKIDTNCGEPLKYSLGRLLEKITSVKEQNRMTNKSIIGYTLLYLLLKANEQSSCIEIDYGIVSNGVGNSSSGHEIKEFEPRWDNVVLDKAEQLVYPLRRCVIVNKNQVKDITVAYGGRSVLLKPNECVVGLFCGNRCLLLLDNVVSDCDYKVTLKLLVKGNSAVPVCEVHRSSGIEYIEGVASIAIDDGGDIVYSTMNGEICYQKDNFALDLRVSTFKEKEYSKDLLAFKKDSSGNYIFYCTNKTDY